MTTKEKILAKTIELLNENGISNVKMRDVSGALNISIGNLTYHFPKFENLFDAITQQFETDLKNIFDNLPKKNEEILPFIEKLYDMQIQYSFIFSDPYHFFNTYPKYENLKGRFFISRMKEMKAAMIYLIENGFLHPEDKDHNYDLLIKRIWLILTYWYSFNKMLKDKSLEMSKQDFFDTLFNITLYYLTDKGKIMLKEIFKNVRN